MSKTEVLCLNCRSPLERRITKSLEPVLYCACCEKVYHRLPELELLAKKPTLRPSSILVKV